MRHYRSETAMLLDLVMLGLLIGLYGLCMALVGFTERLIGPQR
jgi:hypothetical protein